jgi:hypothetical protein
MDEFDDLIREGYDNDALRLMARSYYESGKMGYTRMSLTIRVADKAGALQAENARLKELLGQARDKLKVAYRDYNNRGYTDWELLKFIKAISKEVGDD